MEAYKRRLAKELVQLVNEPPSGVQISEDDAASDFSVWTVTVDGASNTLYEGETFKLRFKFDNQYPFTSPEVCSLSLLFPMLAGDVHRGQHPCSSSHLLQRPHLLIHTRRRLDASIKRSVGVLVHSLNVV
jgi:hypothetical protein